MFRLNREEPTELHLCVIVRNREKLNMTQRGMTMNIYVGNLSYQTTDEELQALFEEFGEVASVKLISDRDTGRSKGFGFVEMPDQDQAMNAIESLNGREHQGRALRVNEAKPRTDKPRGGGGGGGGQFRGRRNNRW